MKKVIQLFAQTTVMLLCIAFSTHGQLRDTYSDTWVAVDELNRATPTNSTVGNPEPNKSVGMFYYIWQNETPGWGIHDISKILAGQAGWGGAPSFHHYGESLYGYYSSKDKFVIRRHMQMLTDAGVDFIFLDNTNGDIYQAVQETILNTLLEMKAEGRKIPLVSWAMYNGDVNAEMELLYDRIASQQKYKELFFNWQGKPLLLGFYTGGRSEVRNYFTIKKSWAWTTQPWYTETGGKDRWSWLDDYPQKPGLNAAGAIEQMSVTAAQHPHGQYAIGKSTGADRTQTPVMGTDGKYVQLQWDRALQVDPPLIMVTQWNEWIAQRFIKNDPAWNIPGVDYMVRQPIPNGGSIFIDVYTPEYSRDLEPMRTAYRDNMYLQMVNNIRKYKGARPIPVSSNAKSINMNTDFSQWANVGPAFIDDRGDAYHRNNTSFGSNMNYINTTGRNDIIESRVSYDNDYVYFYVKTAAAITSFTDANWMNLMLNTDGNYSTGWNGYDYIVNNTVTSSSSTTLKKYAGSGFNWNNASAVDYVLNGNEMQVRIPVSSLGVNPAALFSIDFKWADNAMQSADIIDMYVYGDAAPNNRFNYRFISNGVPVATNNTIWQFQNSMEGWNNASNMIATATNGTANLTLTAGDPNISSPENLSIDAAKFKYVVIRMKNTTSDNIAQLYWSTSADPNFSEAKHVDSPIKPNDSQLTDYIVDLSANPSWTGFIKQLRFDPTQNASSGAIQIDYIKFVGTYPGNIHNIPGIIEAENFNYGGQGNAYNDFEAANKTNAYRTAEGVDMEACTDAGGGFNIDYTVTGEWMEYLVNVATAGDYIVKLRTATLNSGGDMQLVLDDYTIGTVMHTSTTGGWQTFTDLSATVNLPAGKHLLRLSMLASDININKVTFEKYIPVLTPFTQINNGTWLQQNTAVVCGDETVSFAPQPAITTGWSWTGPGGFTSAGRQIILSNLTPSKAGTYIATYIDANGNSNTQNFTLTVNPLPTATITSSANSFCTGGNIVLTASTATSYKWFNGSTQIGTAAAYTATAAGSYTVEVTNANGCKAASAAKIITENALPTSTITSSTNAFCTGGNVVLTASAGTSYKWFNGAAQVGTAATYTANTAGSYTVEVTNANSCKAVSAAKVVSVTASTMWYADSDGDGKGDPAATISACSKPTGYVNVAGDGCPADANKLTPGNCGCNNTEASCLDCAGVPNGSAAIDVCLICSGGTTGIAPITDINQCGLTTGNTNSSNLQGIQVMPNPFYDQLHLTIPEDATIQVIDSKGALIVETTHATTIQTEDFAVGLYILRIVTANGVSVIKIEKQ